MKAKFWIGACLIAFQVGSAGASEIPDLDVSKVCRMEVPAPQIPQCVAQENRAHQYVLQVLPRIDTQLLDNCVGAMKANQVQSYQSLMNCIDDYGHLSPPK